MANFNDPGRFVIPRMAVLDIGSHTFTLAIDELQVDEEPTFVDEVNIDKGGYTSKVISTVRRRISLTAVVTETVINSHGATAIPEVVAEVEEHDKPTPPKLELTAKQGRARLDEALAQRG